MAGIAIAVLLVAYNNLLNLWPPFNKALYVPLNLALATILSLLAVGPVGLSSSDLGLADPDVLEIALAASVGALVSVPLFVALWSGRARRAIADERVRGLWGRRLVYQALVRVPLGTALLEEFAFRGVLFASWRDAGSGVAAVASSAAFGLWHVSPTINLVRANRPDASRGGAAWIVIGAVVFTTAAGLVLTATRVVSGSLLVPFVLHATINSLATVAAAVANRRQSRAS